MLQNPTLMFQGPISTLRLRQAFAVALGEEAWQSSGSLGVSVKVSVSLINTRAISNIIVIMLPPEGLRQTLYIYIYIHTYIYIYREREIYCCSFRSLDHEQYWQQRQRSYARDVSPGPAAAPLMHPPGATAGFSGFWVAAMCFRACIPECDDDDDGGDGGLE